MKKLVIVGAVLFAHCVASAAWTEISLDGAQAWASSEANSDQTAMKVIDGSGFTSFGNCPSGRVDAVASNMWLSQAEAGGSHWVMVKFATASSVGGLKMWNYNVASQTEKSIKEFEVFVTTDDSVVIPTSPVGNALPVPTANWTRVRFHAFIDKASGADDDSGNSPFCLEGNHLATYVLIKSVSHWSADSEASVGLSEIRFYNHTWTFDQDTGVLTDGHWLTNMKVLDTTEKTLRIGSGNANFNYSHISFGSGDLDFTDLQLQTGWKVVASRVQCLAHGGYGMVNGEYLTAIFAPDLCTLENGEDFKEQKKLTVVKLNENLNAINFNTFSWAGTEYNSAGVVFSPTKMKPGFELIGIGKFVGSVSAVFTNGFDFSSCLFTEIPYKLTPYAHGLWGRMIFPATVASVGETAFLACYGNEIEFRGPPPTYAGDSFDTQDYNHFLTIYCDNATYPTWNDWVETPLTDEEKVLYPDGIGWTHVGVAAKFHANLLCRLAPKASNGLIMFVR